MSRVNLGVAAREIRSASEKRRQIEPFSRRLEGFDLAAGYAIARLNHDARVAAGAGSLGRKIGFTNSDMWTAYGVRDPIWAHVYDDTVARIGRAGHCRIDAFPEPKIEPEIVFCLRCAPPVDGALSTLVASIDWVAPGFEIVQSHFPGWVFAAADAVADGGLHAALLVGEPQSIERLGCDIAPALAAFSLALSCDGRLRQTGRGENVLGNPLAAIAYLNRLLASQDNATVLQAGEIVTTGTLTPALPIRAGQTWRAAFEGIALSPLGVTFT